MAPEGPASSAPATSATPGPTGSIGGRLRLACWLVPAALAAGLLAWSVGERLLGTFVPTAEEIRSGAASYAGPVDNSPYLRALRRSAIRNAALYYGAAGLAVGLAAGLVGGLSGRSARGAGRGAVAGGLGGGGLAVAASLALAPVFLDAYRQDQPHLLLPLMLHGGVWIATGAAAGLAFALGRGRGSYRPAAGGAIGAAVGAVASEVLYAVAFPLARGESPVPSESAGRAFVHLFLSASVALGIILAAREAAWPRKKVPAP